MNCCRILWGFPEKQYSSFKVSGLVFKHLQNQVGCLHFQRVPKQVGEVFASITKAGHSLIRKQSLRKVNQIAPEKIYKIVIYIEAIMENPKGKTSKAEMIDINTTISTAISNQIEDINITPPEIPNGSKTTDTIDGVCQPEESQTKQESERCSACNDLINDMEILKVKYNNLVTNLGYLEQAGKMVQEHKSLKSVRCLKPQWEEYKRIEKQINREQQLLIFEKNRTGNQIDALKTEIYENIRSILSDNTSKLTQMKQKLDILEYKITDFFVKKETGIAWYINFRDMPEMNVKNKLDEYFATEQETQKINMDNALEKGDEYGQLTEEHDSEIERDLTLTNSMNNNLKTTHDLSVANELTYLSLKPNQEDLDDDFATEEETQESREELEVAVLWAMQKMKLDNTLENEDELDQTTEDYDSEVDTDLTLVNSMENTLKNTHDLSVADELTNPLPKPNEEDPKEDFGSEEETQDNREELKVAVLSPLQKINLDNGLENGDKQDQITEKHHCEVDKDLILTNALNLKTTNDLSVGDEPTSPSSKPNQKDPDADFATEEEIQEIQENREELRVEVLSPMEKISMDNALENRDEQDDQDLTRTGSMDNNLKTTNNTSVGDESTNPSPNPNQEDLILNNAEDDFEDVYKLMEKLKLSDQDESICE